jgi:uroporphyrinogen decarboxylase
MTNRELFQQIMSYGRFDRMPVVHWTGWTETLERWYGEGLPRGADVQSFLGTRPHWCGIGAKLDLMPAFTEEPLEETDEYRIFRDTAGVIQQAWKRKSCIPHFIGFTLKTAADWPEYKKRLQPDPARIPSELDGQIGYARYTGLPITVGTGSMMGWIRNWMGVENMSYLMYDSPDCYKDMVNTLAGLVCWGLDQVLPRAKALGVVPDLGFGWEDICGRSGPLVSPAIFERSVAQGYRMIREKLESHGVRMLGIDTDGYIEPMLGNWLKAGVNVQFPIEVGLWKAEAMKYRKQYGKDLRIIGHFDKLTLEQSRGAVLAEIERLKPLMCDGGFMMMPDHLITPGVSLDMYRWYLDQVRELRI